MTGFPGQHDQGVGEQDGEQPDGGAELGRRVGGGGGGGGGGGEGVPQPLAQPLAARQRQHGGHADQCAAGGQRVRNDRARRGYERQQPTGQQPEHPMGYGVEELP